MPSRSVLRSCKGKKRKDSSEHVRRTSTAISSIYLHSGTSNLQVKDKSEASYLRHEVSVRMLTPAHHSSTAVGGIEKATEDTPESGTVE